MTAEDILDLVAALDATIDPDTFLRWKRELFWYPDDEAQDTLDQLRRAWRLYLRTLAGPNSVR